MEVIKIINIFPALIERQKGNHIHVEKFLTQSSFRKGIHMDANLLIYVQYIFL